MLKNTSGLDTTSQRNQASSAILSLSQGFDEREGPVTWQDVN